MKYILDTDIGTDIDDALALIYALGIDMPPSLITTVHGNTQVRAGIARAIVESLGLSIPVSAGASKPIKQRHIYWTGIEGIGIDLKSSPRDAFELNAIDDMISLIEQGPTSIVSIGPMTNIALALQKKPSIANNIQRIYVMGNAIVTPDTYFINYRAHNFKVDPEATDIVFEANIPKTLIPTEVVKRTPILKEQLAGIISGSSSASQYLARAFEKWTTLCESDIIYLYDPLVIDVLKYNALVMVQRKDVIIVTENRDSFATECLKTIENFLN